MYSYLLFQLVCASVPEAATFLYCTICTFEMIAGGFYREHGLISFALLFIYAADIVYLRRLQKSLKFAILVGKKSKICDFLHNS